MNEIHVCFSTDDNYAPYCGVAVKSILMNAAPDDVVHVYIMHTNLHTDHMKNFEQIVSTYKSTISFIPVDDRSFESMPLLEGWHFFSFEAYFRFVIARMLPSVDRVIYLDCDVLVRGSLAELYHTEMENWPVAMARDTSVHAPDNPHYNSGVILINCKKWRENSIEQSLFEFVYNNKDSDLFCADQDVINFVLKDSILEIPAEWNFHAPSFPEWYDRPSPSFIEESVKITHYISLCKPWHGMLESKPVDEYYSYAKLVPWDIPDNRERNRGIDAGAYYNYRRELRTYLNKRMLRKQGYLLILTDIGDVRELQYAATDLGIASVEVMPFRESDWHRIRHDYLLVVCKNVLIMDDIMKQHGYDLEKLDYVCLIVSDPDSNDEQIMAEYTAFLSQGGQASR